MSGSKEQPNLLGYPLPTVTEETLDSFLADIEETSDLQVMSEARDRLLFNNLRLYKRIGDLVLASKYDTWAEREAAHDAMILTHEFLRRQAEADVMRTEFGDMLRSE